MSKRLYDFDFVSISVTVLRLLLVKSFRQTKLNVTYLPPPKAAEEHEGESHLVSESVFDKELSSTEPNTENSFKDKGFTDSIVNKSGIELQINNPTTITPIKDQEPIEEGQQQLDDGKIFEGVAVQSSIKPSSEDPKDDKANPKVRTSAKSEDAAAKEKDKQRYKRQVLVLLKLNTLLSHVVSIVYPSFYPLYLNVFISCHRTLTVQVFPKSF